MDITHMHGARWMVPLTTDDLLYIWSILQPTHILHSIGRCQVGVCVMQEVYIQIIGRGR